MSAGLRAITTLALCAASIALFVWQVTDERTVEYLRDNVLRMIPRESLFGAMLKAALLTALLTFGYLVLARERRLVVQRVARIVSPLVLMGFVPAVVIPANWDSLSTLMAVVAFTLVCERLLRSSFAELAVAADDRGELGFSPVTARTKRIALGITMGCVALYAAYASIYAIFDYRRFGTHAPELAQYDNLFYSTLHLHPFRCAPLALLSDWQYLGSRAEPSVFAFLPFYALRPGPETLLVVRAVVLGLGALAVFGFAARRMHPKYAALLSVAYLFYPPLHALNVRAFSLEPFAVTCLLFGILWMDSRRWIPAAIAFAVALGCGEGAALGIAALGLYSLLAGYRPKAGAVMVSVAAAYLVAVKLFVVPHFSASWSEEARHAASSPDDMHQLAEFAKAFASGPASVFRGLLTPDKLGYLLQVMAPVALLPLRRAYLVPAAAPGTLLALAAAKSSSTIDVDLPHSEQFLPFVFAASVVALASYRSEPMARIKFSAAAAALLVGSVLCTIHWGAIPPRAAAQGFLRAPFERPSPIDDRKAHDLADLLSMIPPDATYAVTDQELAHVARRLTVRSIKYQPSADYILYGVDAIGADIAVRGLDRQEYVRVASRPDVALLARKR